MVCSGVLSYFSYLYVLLAVRVEYAKAKAWHNRWREEVLLLVEELCRCKEFSVWQSEKWLRKWGARPDTNPELREGLDAYAYLQAEYKFQYAQQVDQRWAKLREHAQQVVDCWIWHYWHLSWMMAMMARTIQKVITSRPCRCLYYVCLSHCMIIITVTIYCWNVTVTHVTDVPYIQSSESDISSAPQWLPTPSQTGR